MLLYLQIYKPVLQELITTIPRVPSSVKLAQLDSFVPILEPSSHRNVLRVNIHLKVPQHVNGAQLVTIVLILVSQKSKWRI